MVGAVAAGAGGLDAAGIGVVEDVAERCPHIVGVNVGAARDRLRGDADRGPVLRDLLAFGDVGERELVAARDVFEQRDAIVGKVCAGRKRLERHRDGVEIVDFEGEGH